MESRSQRYTIASAHEEEGEEAGEVEDLKEQYEAECMETKACSPVKARFDSCQERVQNSDGSTGETCVEEFFDLMHCVNECAPEKLFHHLK